MHNVLRKHLRKSAPNQLAHPQLALRWAAGYMIAAKCHIRPVCLILPTCNRVFALLCLKGYLAAKMER